MGQDTKVGQSSYSRLTVPVTGKEEATLQLEARYMQEVEADRKREQRLFIYQVLLVATLITAAIVKEKFFPSGVEWVDGWFNKF